MVSIPAHQQALAERHLDILPELVEALEASSTDDCVDCGLPLGGLLGMFTWDIVHGHGYCSACKFPYVYYHYHEVSPAVTAPMRHPRPAEELLLMAFVPNAEMPLKEKETT